MTARVVKKTGRERETSNICLGYGSVVGYDSNCELFHAFTGVYVYIGVVMALPGASH